MSLFPEQQGGFDYPMPLSERYRPRRINDFIGLAKERKILTNFCAKPRDGAFLFVGPSGLGKTTMALAMAEELGAELHHIPSGKANLENVEEMIRMCWYVAQRGGFHICLFDEADRMSQAAQLALLSKLDSTARPPKTIFIFTANETGSLEKRFLSRCMVLEFSSYGLRAELAQFLAKVWEQETSAKPTVDFERIAKDSQNNCRDALSVLEIELLAIAA
jgi:putative ATPase